MRASVILLTLLGLAACSTAVPQIVGAPPPGIAYRVENGGVAATAERADHYCAQFAKHAELQSVDRSGDAQIAQYSCS